MCCVFRCILCCLRSFSLFLCLSRRVRSLFHSSFGCPLPLLVYALCLDFIQHSFYVYVCSLLHSHSLSVFVCVLRAVDAAGFEFDICIHALHTGRHTNTNVNINKENEREQKLEMSESQTQRYGCWLCKCRRTTKTVSK